MSPRLHPRALAMRQLHDLRKAGVPILSHEREASEAYVQPGAEKCCERLLPLLRSSLAYIRDHDRPMAQGFPPPILALELELAIQRHEEGQCE